MSHQQQQVQPPAAPPLVTFVPPPAGLTGAQQQPLPQQPQQQQQPPLIVQGLPPGFITAPSGSQLPVAQPMSNPPTLFQAAGPTSAAQQPQLQHQPITLVQTAGTPPTTATQMTTQMMMNSPPGSITSYSIGGSMHSQHLGANTTTNASSSNTFGGGGVSATLPTEVLAAVHGVCAPPPVTTGGGGAGNPLGSSLGGGSSRGNASGSGYSSNSGPGGALPLEVMAAVTSASSTAAPVFAQPQQQPQPLILSSSSAGLGGIAPATAPFTAIGPPPPPVVAKAAGEGEVGNQGFTVNKKIVYDKTNVFVSSIGLDVTEKQLEEVFSEVGRVVNCKILMEYSTGTSKGCGFVHYGTKEEANKAAEELNGRTIGKSSIRVRLADNCAEFGPEESNKLFVRNIPTAVTIEELKSAFSPFGLVVGGNIMPDTSREGRREGLGLNMGYVTFQDVSCAMTAARELQKRTDVFPSQKGTTSSSHGLEIKPAESLQVRNLRKSPASGATSGHTTPLKTTTANAQLSVIPPQPGGAIQLAPSPAPVAVPHRAGGPPPPPQQVVVPLSGQLPVAPPQQQSTTLIPQSGSGQPAAAPAFISGALPTGGGLTSPVVTQPSPYPQSQQVITAAVAPPLTSGALPIAAPPNPTLTTTTGNGGTSISTNNGGGPPLLPSFSPNVPVGGGVAGVGTAGNGGTVLVASSPQFLQQQQQAPGAGHPQQVIFRASQ